MGERILQDFSKVNPDIKIIALRYFNPVGAHSSGKLGEMPLLRPDNLIPVMTQTAIGKRESFEVFGGNFNTRDGSCIRDFVHVMDIAEAHVLALQRLGAECINWETINLGSGKGVSVFEAIRTLEEVSGLKLKYTIGEARVGDVVEIYSNVEKAKTILGWMPKFDLTAMISSAWKWELELLRLGH